MAIAIESAVDSQAPREKLISSPTKSGSATAAAINARLVLSRNMIQTSVTMAGASAAL